MHTPELRSSLWGVCRKSSFVCLPFRHEFLLYPKHDNPETGLEAQDADGRTRMSVYWRTFTGGSARSALTAYLAASQGSMRAVLCSLPLSRSAELPDRLDLALNLAQNPRDAG
jgi:hypothetical protein